MTDFEAENKKLRDHISHLEEVIKIISCLNEPDKLFTYRVLFNLQRKPAQFLLLLEQRYIVTHEALQQILWPDDPTKNPDDLCKIYKWRVQRSLKKYDIHIRTDWGVGYYMTKENKDKLKKLYKNATGDTQ